MTVWAAVPVKALEAAKGRLAPMLAPAERAALIEAMLAEVVHALQANAAIARVLVISPDPAARALARQLGAEALADPAALRGPRHQPDSLNAAIDEVARLAAAGGAEALLILPADLPLVRPADVAAVLDAPLPAPSMVLVPTADGGTGALLRTPPLVVPACFGPRSVQAHLAAAAARGVRTRLLWRRSLTLDCDRPADLVRLVTGSHGGATAALLSAWGVTERAAAVPAWRVEEATCG